MSATQWKADNAARDRASKLATQGGMILGSRIYGAPQSDLLRAEHALREALQIIETLKQEGETDAPVKT